MQPDEQGGSPLEGLLCSLIFCVCLGPALLLTVSLSWLAIITLKPISWGQIWGKSFEANKP